MDGSTNVRAPETSARDALIHELFEAQVLRRPDAVAVICGDRTLTYAQLNRAANQLARYLVNEGVGPDRLVGVCVARSIEMVTGLLGILKAGGAYLPLDPNYPAERLRYMLEDAAPILVLTEEELRGMLPDTDVRALLLHSKLREIAGYVTENLAPSELGLTAQHLLYVIYTSGSTGRPKGTVMPHRPMVNLMEWHRETFGAAEGKRVLQFAALSFDVAFQEIFSTLCTGGTLVVPSEWVRRDAGALNDLLCRQRVERLFVPPLMLQSLAECVADGCEVPRSLRDIVTAGEQLRVTPEIVRYFARLDGCRLHNHYGPTETHVVTALTLSGRSDEWPQLPTIGRPIANTSIYLLDEQRAPVPPGAVGEIYIGGCALARGYLARPELTAERFILDPFSCAPQARLYKTGDQGRWRPDGTLEYLGRNDDQVKIRGFRVELGEIEAQLLAHERISGAAVVAREDIPGQKRLVAYIVPRGEQPPAGAELRARLQSALPEHMIPSAFVVLSELPVTPSGKLDRRALPAPGLDAYVSAEYAAPEGEIEEVLAQVWQRLLGVERVGRHDDFFALGGHSLLMVKMMEQLRRRGLHADVHDVFARPELARLATVLRKTPGAQTQIPPNQIPPGCTQITPDMLPLVDLDTDAIERIVQTVPGGAANVQDIYPLTPLQEGILFHHLLDAGGGDTYVLPMLLSMSSRAALDRFATALQEVIDRHDVLRTALVWEQLLRPVQVVYRKAVLPVQERILDPNTDAMEQVRVEMGPDRQKIDLRRAPLMELVVMTDSRGYHCYAVLRLDHLICDHESAEVILDEIKAYIDGGAVQLPAPVPYRNHVAELIAHSRPGAAESFFRQKLGDLEEPTVSFGLADVYGDARHIVQDSTSVEPQLAGRLRAVARSLGVTPATLFHAAWSLVVARTSGREDVVFGTLLLGRLLGSAGMERSLGMFINTLPLRLKLAGVSARELVERTQRELVQLLEYEQASLAVAQRCSGISGSAPLFNSLLNYRHSVRPDTETLPLASDVQVLELREWTNYPVTLSVDDLETGFALTAQTHRRLEPRRVLGYLEAALGSLVDALERDPRQAALSLSVLPASEQQEILRFAGSEQPQASQEKLIHEWFEAQVARTPHAVAVRCEGRSLTYAELNARANQLARYLRTKGVQPEELVGLYVERSLEMIIGVIAILKAGGAYLPLDPNYPAERLAYMLADSAPKVLLTQEILRAQLPPGPATVIAMDRWEEIAAAVHDTTNARVPGLRTDQLAYIIYTSGSTGRPKGVMVEHRNVTRLFTATAQWFGFNERDVWTLFHSIAFDFSVWELWGALFYGGCVVVVPYFTARAPRDFYELLCNEGVTVLNQTPSAFAQLIDAQGGTERRHALRFVIFGGEALELRTLRPWTARNGVTQPQLVNMYGITETTVHVTYCPLTDADIAADAGSLIGRAIPDLRVYLLDGSRQAVPIGVPGEIFVGGAGVARGYLNQPELTEARFVRDPFSSEAHARMYKSGDLGRWRADGVLEYLGRNDHQVKIRGFRIELGEIEAQVARYPQVKDAVVIAREDQLGQKLLVGYVTLRDEHASLNVEGLRAHLRSMLPEYMVPGAFVKLAHFPLTPSGKLDRRSLPRPELESCTSRSYRAPEGDIERLLADVWRELLRVPRVGRDDHFFEIGGHSLLAMQVAVRVEAALGIELPMRLLFTFPTVKGMAAQIEELRRARLLDELAEGGDEVEALLERVAAMPESQVRELMRELKMEGRI